MTGSARRLAASAEALAASLPPLALEAGVVRAAAAGLGRHGRRKAGLGQSFWQFHRYREGDDAAAVDWRQSAKSSHLFVREHEWETAQTVYLWRSGGASMRTGVKRDRASLLLLALGFLLVRGGERIALYGAAEPPAASRAATARIAHSLCAAGAGEALPPPAAAVRSARFVWFGDFLLPLEEIAAALSRLSGLGLTGRLVQIADPVEADFPFAGRIRFTFGGEEAMFGRADTVAEAYRRRFAGHCQAIKALALSQGWTYRFHRTDRPAKEALAALYAETAGESA
jgi:uncharacterized protein (DUF58 family)